MNKSFLFVALFLFANLVNAVDLEKNVSNLLKYEKWFVVELTTPTAMAYRIGAESNLPASNQTIFIDITPINNCEAEKVTVNQFIGYKQMDFTGVPFIPVKYKISGQEIKDSVTHPEVSDGFLFTPIGSMKIQELLKANDKGNLSFWIQPPAEKPTPINKMFFPLKGFTKAFNKAVQLCKENS